MEKIEGFPFKIRTKTSLSASATPIQHSIESPSPCNKANIKRKQSCKSITKKCNYFCSQMTWSSVYKTLNSIVPFQHSEVSFCNTVCTITIILNDQFIFFFTIVPLYFPVFYPRCWSTNPKKRKNTSNKLSRFRTDNLNKIFIIWDVCTHKAFYAYVYGVCVGACVGVCMWIHIYVARGQHQGSLPQSITLLLGKNCCWVWSSPHQLGWVASKHQESTCLCLPSA